MERLAFSVIWEMTPGADVVSVRFTKSLIRSAKAMTYEEAQTQIDDVRLDDDVTLSLRLVMKVTRILRAARHAPAPLGIC